MNYLPLKHLLLLLLFWSIVGSLLSRSCGSLTAWAHQAQVRGQPCTLGTGAKQSPVEEQEMTSSVSGGTYRLQIQLVAMTALDDHQTPHYCGKASARGLLWVPPGGHLGAYCVLLNPTVSAGEAMPPIAPVCWQITQAAVQSGGPLLLQTPYEVIPGPTAALGIFSDGKLVQLNPQTVSYPAG